MSDNQTKDTSGPLAETPQGWNWLGLSQTIRNNNTAKLNRSASVHNHRNTAPSNNKSKRPLLHNELLTYTQLKHTKPKTIFTATDRKQSVKINTEVVEEFSALRITNRTISAEVLREEMEGRKFIKLSLMDCAPKETFTNKEVDWVTIGVLVRKTLSKPATNGSTFMVWALSDLDGTELGIFLFGDAYVTHWKESTGSIVAILNATLLPASEKNKFAFKVTQPTEIVTLGKAMDFGICKGKTSGEARCRLAINKAKTQYCLHHIAVNFMEAGKGRQQLNNSTGSLRKSLFAGLSKPKNLSAGVYSSASSNSGNSRWDQNISRKRKRNDTTTGGLIVPTVIVASGAVVQQRDKQFDHFVKVRGENQQSSLSLMDQLRQPPSSMKSKRVRLIEGSASARVPSSRAQKIVSAFLSGDKKPLARSHVKKVNMMQFMNSGIQSEK
ncbi:putative minichromosome maintenance protein [Plasmopara halstedii]